MTTLIFSIFFAVLGVAMIIYIFRTKRGNATIKLGVLSLGILVLLMAVSLFTHFQNSI